MLSALSLAEPADATGLAQQALLAMAYLLFKHALADYAFQTSYQFGNKGMYGHPGGFVHGAVHVLLTAPVFLILPPASLGLAVLLLGAEFLVHYHIDWAKEQFVKARGLTSNDAAFWRAMGLDQLLHGLTYVAIVWVLVVMR
jgi:hypothetical protein